MENINRRKLLKGITAVVTGGISTSGLWLPRSLYAQSHIGGSEREEFLEYRQQMQSDFSQYKADLMAEFNSYVRNGTLNYEKKYEEILTKQEPTRQDIERNNNDKEKAEIELDIIKDTISDEFEHGEKGRLIDEAEKALIAKWPKDKKKIQQLKQEIEEDENNTLPPVPSIKEVTPAGPLVSVLHRYNPKPFNYPFADEYRLSSYFGIRNLRMYNRSLKKHCGIDIAAPRGTPIFALANGVVNSTFNHKFGGKSIVIDCDQLHEGKKLRYSAFHLHRFNSHLGEGSRVIQGETVIGYVGSTGRATGPHIHLNNYEFDSTYGKWIKVNPLKYTKGCELPKDYKSSRYQFETCAQIARKI